MLVLPLAAIYLLGHALFLVIRSLSLLLLCRAVSHAWSTSDTLVLYLLRASTVDLRLSWTQRDCTLLLPLNLLECAQLLLAHLLELSEGPLPALSKALVLRLSEQVDGDVVEIVHDLVELDEHDHLQVLEVEAHQVLQLLLGLSSGARDAEAHE